MNQGRDGRNEALVRAVMERIRDEARWAFPDHPGALRRQMRTVGVLLFVLLGLVLLASVGLIQKGAPIVEPETDSGITPYVGSGPLEHAPVVRDPQPFLNLHEAIAAAGGMMPYRPFWTSVTINATLVFGLFGGLIALLLVRWWIGRP
ncbi:MAG: hypothetical protein IMW86_06075 [Hydrogenibacillus sp.]|nr:hypothetical protein [Hydrogenibacillus sp.]